MKVLVESLTEEAIERRDYRDALRVTVDDEEVFCVCDGEPEDANLSRDFNDCWRIPNLMKKAHDAGKRGEDFEIKSIEVDEL